MNIASMFLRILAILGAVAAGVMFYIIGNTKEQLEQDLQNEQQRLASTQNNLNSLKSEHEELQEEAETLSSNLQEEKSRANNLNSELKQVRKELDEAKKTISDRKRESEKLEAEAAEIRRQLMAEKQRADELSESLEGEDAEALRASVRELERQLLRTEQELQNLGSRQPTVEEEKEDRKTVLRGSVKNAGENSAYIIIDLGETDGVHANATVMLRRGPKYIGRARISEVRNDESIAELLSSSTPVQQGDQAITLN